MNRRYLFVAVVALGLLMPAAVTATAGEDRRMDASKPDPVNRSNVSIEVRDLVAQNGSDLPGTGPQPLDAPPGLGAEDPWVDANGDEMFGALEMGPNVIRLNGRDLKATMDGELTFAGHTVCVEGASSCGGQAVSGQTPIAVEGSTVILSSQDCGAGEMWKWGGSAWDCRPDADTTYDGSDFALSDQSCASGDVVAGVDAFGVVVCVEDATTTTSSIDWANVTAKPSGFADDVDNDTTYDGSDFALSDQACPSGEAVAAVDAGGTLVCVEAGSSSVDWANVSEKPSGFADDVDNNTTYDGSDFALSDQSCTSGEVVAGVNASGNVVCVVDEDTTAGAGAGLSDDGSGNHDVNAGDGLAIASDSVALDQSCASGEVLQWDGSSWTCSAVEGGSVDAWLLGGNSGTTSSDFLGTTDVEPLLVKVDGTQAYAIRPTSGTPNVVGGNASNAAGSSVQAATVAGGGSGGGPNEALADYATVGGGLDNTAGGLLATVPGGSGNNASGDYSFAAGAGANATHDGAFVWSDSTTTSEGAFQSTASDQFLIDASGGVGIGTNDPFTALDVSGTVTATDASLGTGSIGSAEIADGTVDSADIGARAVGTSEVTNDIATGPGDEIFDSGTLSIDASSDEVGVGTTSPGSTLDVAGNADVGDGDLFVDDSSNAVGIGTFSPGSALDVDGDLDAGGGDLFVDAFNDRVGIGTTNPGTALEVSGTILASDASLGSGSIGSNEIASGAVGTSEVTSDIATGPGDESFDSGTLFVDASSDGVGLGTTSPNGRLDVQGSSNLGGIVNVPSTLWADPGNDRVGIGTTSPSHTLDVDGDTNVGDTDLFVDASLSRVGIRTTSPNHPFHMAGDAAIVNGGLCVESDNNCADDTGFPSDGEVQAPNGFTTAHSDLAEVYPTDEALQPAEVVTPDEIDDGEWTRATAADEGPLRVVSTDPGVLLGEPQNEGSSPVTEEHPWRLPSDHVPIALEGRVPVKVTAQNGAIETGDALAVSPTPGVAERADEGDPVIGKALEDLEAGTGTIEVFVSPTPGSADVSQLQQTVDEQDERIDQLEAENQQLREKLDSFEDRLEDLEAEHDG